MTWIQGQIDRIHITHMGGSLNPKQNSSIGYMGRTYTPCLSIRWVFRSCIAKLEMIFYIAIDYIERHIKR